MAAPAPVRRSWGQRLRARLRGAYEEDGVFRPVRLPLWIDLGVSALIVLAAAASFVGFFAWLAHTQGR
ncbi:hypothetical protein GCM10011376_21100 [Nocardioides flavus (ex Wang et al. 2016)]|uniref:Uncharacterized protein n=1 Tax=Nocardioides flavus (ex Wang et al. 2016) TaxID=2058780 RepID=A0ABQ3HKR1_9ACTN|nr:hypothetical protein [Nocardioides flavus (ex Wang et al. 2016)]GHE17500.1 hypothetical protein GCM10011376_21100 [Nocardioides flavus (ex Wang et al. 2016)]